MLENSGKKIVCFENSSHGRLLKYKDGYPVAQKTGQDF